MEVNATGSGSCPLTGFDISGAEPGTCYDMVRYSLSSVTLYAPQFQFRRSRNATDIQIESIHNKKPRLLLLNETARCHLNEIIF
jgi:hypothetical protein